MKGGGANLVINLLVAQPTPEKKFPEVVPILKECGKFCEEGSPESLKNLIHITHAFEDPKGAAFEQLTTEIRVDGGTKRRTVRRLLVHTAAIGAATRVPPPHSD